MLHNTPNQLPKFGAKNWIEINDQSRGVYNVNSNIRFKTNLCNYSDAYIHVKGKITITGVGADAAARQADEKDEEVIIKNCGK